MSKTSSDLCRYALNGNTMGTRWSVVLYAPPDTPMAPLRSALQDAVDMVDAQMSFWNVNSDLMRFNAAPEDTWHSLPRPLLDVLDCALRIGRLSQGAFEIALGDAVSAWGFGPQTADATAIQAARMRSRQPSYTVLELDPAGGRAIKHAPLTLDLGGIAKGYGVDRLTDVLHAHGVKHALAAIDGELRAIGSHPDGKGWAVAVEQPDQDQRAVHSVFELHDAAIATSGNYRHFTIVGERRLAHTMDPQRGMPVLDGPASATVVYRTCMEADALATVLMVQGEKAVPLLTQAGAQVLLIP